MVGRLVAYSPPPQASSSSFSSLERKSRRGLEWYRILVAGVTFGLTTVSLRIATTLTTTTTTIPTEATAVLPPSLFITNNHNNNNDAPQQKQQQLQLQQPKMTIQPAQIGDNSPLENSKNQQGESPSEGDGGGGDTKENAMNPGEAMEPWRHRPKWNALREELIEKRRKRLEGFMIHYNHTALARNTAFDGKYAIFFNLYIPPNAHYTQLAAIWEQFGYIRRSQWKNDPIYYNLIGSVNTTSVCPPDFKDRCHEIGRYEEGWEDKTLTSLLHYCRLHPDHTVAYLHNKGSFSNNPGNHKNRRLATIAVMSDACRSLPHTYFNTCGLRFNLLPFVHFSTNLWAARCDYVQNLVPPVHYGPIRERMCDVFVEAHREASCYTNRSDPSYAQDNGYGRMAMERWIVSHPMLSPAQAHLGDLQNFNSGHEEWEPLLWPPLVSVLKLPADDVRQRIKFQLKQFYYVYGQYAPPNGCCQHVFSKVQPPVCHGQTFKFQSIYQDTTAGLLQQFDDETNATRLPPPWERTTNVQNEPSN